MNLKLSFTVEIVVLFMSIFGIKVISLVKASVKPVAFRNKWIRMNSDLTSTVVNNANIVQQRIEQAASKSNRDPSTVRLVAVSKTKPVEAIKALYDAGYRHFGENYFQELTDKAPQLPNDIKWHFIGHLQSSKSNKLIRDVPNLYMLETIDSDKLANKLQKACAVANREVPLYVLIQIDTSNEDTKSGVTQDELLPLVDYINKECPLLKLGGLMTIGAPGDLTCFDTLVKSRERVAQHMHVAAETLELSMGMSGDFEEAIARGATSVRVGSTIFGERIYPNKL